MSSWLYFLISFFLVSLEVIYSVSLPLMVILEILINIFNFRKLKINTYPLLSF